jgi:hypothetical protein
MGLSETIVAAIIGALATMATAIVQLIRNRAPSEGRPKKNRTRSVLATIALMIGCIVGGYAWSSLRAVNNAAREKEERSAELQAAIATYEARRDAQLAAARAESAKAAVAARSGDSGVAETLANLPACRISTQPDEVGPVSCTEQSAHKIALCAAIPASAAVSNLRVQARVPGSEEAWGERDAGATTLGSLHTGSETREYPVDPDRKSVCLDVSNWSVEDTLAVRLIIEYAFPAAAAVELTAATPAHTL